MSDTPKTDLALSEADTAYGKGNHYRGIQVIMRKMETLERSHNALIAKLEVLAKEWKECSGGNYDDFFDGEDAGFREAGAALDQLIQEAKQ